MNLIQSNAITMSSREIAELVGSKHEAVRKSAERLSADQILTSPLATFDYEHRGNLYQEYRFNKRDSLVLVARLSPEFTAAIVDRWQELERGFVPQTMAQALRLAADQAEQIEQQQKALALAAPKVEFVDQYVENTGTMTFRQVCKLLKANERVMRQLLSDKRVMYKLSGEWVPYAHYLHAGCFEVKTGTAQHSDHAFTSARFTAKGVECASRIWRNFVDSQSKISKNIRMQGTIKCSEIRISLDSSPEKEVEE